MMYVQCKMKKQLEFGYLIDTSWIEEKFAVVGKTVKRKTDNDDEWNEGWVITETYGQISEKEAKFLRDLHKHHRKATDV